MKPFRKDTDNNLQNITIFCFCSHFLVYVFPTYFFCLSDINVTLYLKGALTSYGKLTWESAHAWNLIILCLLIVWGMIFICMVHLSFYAIPLLFYDVMY